MSQSPAPTLEQFEAVLRRYDSATIALEHWCMMRGLSAPAHVTAKLLKSTGLPTPRSLPEKLALEAQDSVAVRHVELSCEGNILSIAWNWYVPARLTPQMNEALHLTDMPFGKVIAPLGFVRQPLSKFAGREADCPVGTISTHRALLTLPNGRPLAYLVECYTRANLDI